MGIVKGRGRACVSSAVLFLLGLAVACTAPGAATAAAAAVPPAAPVRIGFVLDGPWDRNAEVLQLVQSEIRELLDGTHEVRFPGAATIEADWTPPGVSAALDQLLADPEVDIVIALGILASDRACRTPSPAKPLIAPAVIDARLQGLPDRDGASGVRNLVYFTIPSAVERDLRAFRELAPFDRLAVLVNQASAGSVPGLDEELREQLAGLPVPPVVVPVGSSARRALAQLPADAQAVYVLPLLQLSSASFDSLVAGLNERKLLSFSSLGERDVQRGILAGVRPDVFPKLARRLAVTVQLVLAGEDPGTLPTTFSVGERLKLNVATARAIGFYPTWADLSEADLVDEESTPVARTLSLGEAMNEALAANRDLAVAAQRTAAGRYDVRQAYSALLPQAEVSADGILIDEDRARASFGAQAERTVSATASATQVVFSEPALARTSIERQLQAGREWEYESLRLDIVREAGGAYLRVLRAKTGERVQRQNLRLTRDHLELARTREAVGSSGMADVYRWESEIATNRKSAIDANAARNLAEMELNRILRRSAEEPFATQETTLDDPEIAEALEAPLAYFREKGSFRLFRDFMVQEGLAASPELRNLDTAIAAARRGYQSTGRSFYLPSLALQGSVTNELDRSGAGSEPLSLPGLAVDPADGTDWSIGLRASLPLLRGGATIAERSQTRIELERLGTEREAAAERVEQRIRAALHQAGASYAGIRETRNAADWARRNLELVADAYAHGGVSLIDLLDAQNAYTLSDEAAADAVYDFLDDFLEVERSSGRFTFLMTQQERDEFRERLHDFATGQGARAPH
jgi:outer membrane protein TolC